MEQVQYREAPQEAPDRGFLSDFQRMIAHGADDSPNMAALSLVQGAADRWARLYYRLADEESRRLLLNLLVYNALGPRDVPLLAQADGVERRYEPVASAIYEPQPGDIVIDVGAGWGGAALHFAYCAGPYGQVYCFEHRRDAAAIFRKNLDRNPVLRDRIVLSESPIWWTSNETLYLTGAGEAASWSEQQSPGAREALTRSIDDYVIERGVERVDFVKFDVQGAENEALAGAACVVGRDQPVLAICIDHRLDDFYILAELIDTFNVGYEYRLQPLSVHGTETALLAYCRSRIRR